MHVDMTTGLVAGAEYLPSPNCDARPDPADISLLLIHGISLPPGDFGGPWIDDLFCNRLDPAQHPYFAEIRELKVSSHFLIQRDGGLKQYVPLQLRAWHAGVSSFQGRDCCNDYSIGVELEGTDEEPYEDIQYTMVASLTRCLMQAFPALTLDRIVGHSEVAPGRKTDPGPAFNWRRYRSELQQ